jgi:hypothetical protein
MTKGNIKTMTFNFKKIMDKGISKTLAVTVIVAAIPLAMATAAKEYVKEKKEQ